MVTETKVPFAAQPANGISSSAEPRFERLFSRVRAHYDNSDPGHDFLHIQRVLASAYLLGVSVSADLGILLPAALLHDVINVPKNHPDRALASAQAAAAARAHLEEYDEREVAHIQRVITEHSFSLGRAPSCIESACLQDADRLDAIGAVGIMRTVSCGARMGSQYYDEVEPVATTRALDDKRHTIDHFHVKLLKLAAGMHTPLAQQEAASRTQFMHAFLAQLGHELSW